MYDCKLPRAILLRTCIPVNGVLFALVLAACLLVVEHIISQKRSIHAGMHGKPFVETNAGRSTCVHKWAALRR